MNNLVWTKGFYRKVKKILKQHPELISRIDETFEYLEENVFHPILHSHKLKGNLSGSWACFVNYDYRIIFEITENEDTGESEILLLSFGTHDDVY